MSTDLYSQICSYSNLELAYKKARKKKTLKPYVIEFEKDLKQNLLTLQSELLFHIYTPQPLQEFIIRDPKTRTIHRSDFRDRIIHHALCNIIEPLFEKSFIYDSYANRKGKGTLKAIQRFQTFSRKVSYNNTTKSFVLKADIKKYFENVDCSILLLLLQRKISDQRVLWLVTRILNNYHTKQKGVGMPLGNLTSQFFANVYLHELDHFVKQHLKAQYYIRYVDDFVIMDKSSKILEKYKSQLDYFLQSHLALELHPSKSKIIPLRTGVEFLGLRIFPHHLLLKQKNVRYFKHKFSLLTIPNNLNKIPYDKIYDFMEGWCAYAKHANTYNLRQIFIAQFEEQFPTEISSKEINRIK